jgi:hypothetical protein
VTDDFDVPLEDEIVEAGLPFSPITADTVLSEAQEQKIRDHFGYSKSETRTKAERDAAAQRIIERLPAILAKIESER